jgi:hypothetical protein
LDKEIWFELIKQWKSSGRGHYGLTFPFLIGALAIINKEEPTRKFVTDIFTKIITKPVTGFYGEVRWCGNIDEPVISVSHIENLPLISIKDSFKINGVTSLAFTTDLMDMFHLDCETAKECLNKLIEHTYSITKDNVFSKNGGVFTVFSNDDLHFISEISGVKSAY